MKMMAQASIQARITALEAEIASKRAKLEEVTKNLKYIYSLSRLLICLCKSAFADCRAFNIHKVK